MFSQIFTFWFFMSLNNAVDRNVETCKTTFQTDNSAFSAGDFSCSLEQEGTEKKCSSLSQLNDSCFFVWASFPRWLGLIRDTGSHLVACRPDGLYVQLGRSATKLIIWKWGLRQQHFFLLFDIYNFKKCDGLALDSWHILHDDGLGHFVASVQLRRLL